MDQLYYNVLIQAQLTVALPSLQFQFQLQRKERNRGSGCEATTQSVFQSMERICIEQGNVSTSRSDESACHFVSSQLRPDGQTDRSTNRPVADWLYQVTSAGAWRQDVPLHAETANRLMYFGEAINESLAQSELLNWGSSRIEAKIIRVELKMFCGDTHCNLTEVKVRLPVAWPVFTRSQAVMGSNPTRVMDICV
jgi:hypothetical protein